MIRSGDTVGGYEILSKLSAGGMATLFLGRRGGAAGFRKHVAIKVVHEHLAEDRMFVQMFVDEALLSSRIQHPNVVHIEELRELDGQHFLVMEYVSGVSLAQLMRRLSRLSRRMTPELAAHVAIQVADGLHAAHELKDEAGELEGVVHRDVSPQNVLLAWEGHVKLIDFGVAKARSRIQQTTGASMKGKLRYMAPEQARGAEVDRRTDVYALGILLWEMLTMKRRFHGPNDFALLDQVRNPEPVAPSQLNPAISPELDAVAMRALAVSMDDRYATAQEFRRALAASLPRALALDASHLSELVRAACTQELDKARARLPSSMHLPSEIPVELDEEAEPLRTMTLSASQAIEYLEGEPGSAGFTPSASSGGASTSGVGHTPHTASVVEPAPARGKALERRPVWRAEETQRASAARGGSARRGDARASLSRDGPVMAALPPVNSGDFKPVGALALAAAAALVIAAVGGALALSSHSSSGVAVPLAPREVAPTPATAAAPPSAVTPATPTQPQPAANREPAEAATPDAATGEPEVQPAPERDARSSRMRHDSRSSTMRASGRRSATMQASHMRASGMHGMSVPLADDFGF